MNMLPEISIKESELIHPEVKDLSKRENSKQTQLPSNDNGCSNQEDNSQFQKFKFYFIKCTEETKTGFPILPAALNPCFNNNANVTDSTKSCRIPLRNLPENADSILIPGIRNFLWKCYNYADKRRRSSRVCKHKPGVKHYCRRKNWDTILSKYKTEVLDNPLIDLGTFYKANFQSYNKEFLIDKQNDTQNKAGKPLVLTNYKEHSPQQINSRNKEAYSLSKNSEIDIIPQDAPCTSSDANPDNLDSQNYNEKDDMSLFLAIFGLKRKISQKEVKCTDLKLANAETSNNAKEEYTANLDEISGGIGPETNSIDVVEESTNNKMGLEMNSKSNNLGEIRDEAFQEFPEDRCASTENINHSEEGKAEIDTTSEQNSEYFDVNTTQGESSDSSHTISGNGSHENSMSSSPRECLCHSERVSCQVNPVNETCISLHSSVDVNNFLVDNLLKTGSWNATSGPPVHTSVSVKCETRGHITNNNEQEMSNIGNHVISSFQGPFPRNPGSHTCPPRHMYAPTGGMNGVFPNIYGSPCLPTPVIASPFVSPVFAYNVLPMNNIMCASHPGLMPFPNNGGYLSTSFDCTSHQSVHHSIPLSFHSAQSNPSYIHHKPGFQQLVNVNTSAIVPCWTQSTYTGGTHLPCCGGSSHALEARSQLHFTSGYYPTDSYNSFVSQSLNTDVHVANDVVNVTCRNTDDVK